jgi:hypothetical protein
MPRPRPPIPQRAIDASRRLVGPARVLAPVARTLEVAGALAALVLAVVVALRVGLAAAAVTAVVLALPAVWLHHVAGAFTDLVTLPDQLQAVRDGTPLVGVTRRELHPRALRRRGAGGAARTLLRTAREVADAVGPASTAVEVATPTFWVWTATAAVAAVVLTVVAVVVLLVGLVRAVV